jgi:hypothetical protein
MLKGFLKISTRLARGVKTSYGDPFYVVTLDFFKN